MIGAVVGPYRIVEKLGEGGMGEVYRAHDVRLDRDVALKILPLRFTADAERLTRFEREARMLAGLNHPNIAGIYGVEESGATRALVMELVDGPTLEDLIRPRGLPLDEALPIARQIAAALEAAHAAGVIHRDLKPANIKVRADGTVKVLDFGLAKVFDATAASASNIANSPTVTGGATELGTILGTAAYMAPEQARGKVVDKRADLWAFGCVLFEMLTGRQTFAGETTTDILAAVVTSEPDWSRLPAGTPASLRTLLRRCLTKDPAQRLADASTARLDIDDARLESTGVSPIGDTTTHVSRRRGAWPWILAGVTTLVAVVALVVAVRRPQPVATPVAEMRFQIDEALDDAAVSPDGTGIVYRARVDGQPRWVLRSLTSGASKPIQALGQDIYELFWSPDSRSIAFLAAQKLKRIDLATGAVQTLADAPTPRGGTWGPDGTILFAPGGNGPLYRVAAAGGTPEPATALGDRQATHRFPEFLPDGKHFLFWVLGPAGVRGEYLGSLDDRRKITRLLDADGPASFAWPDDMLFIREGVLYSQRLDVAGAKTIGDAVPIASHFQVNSTAGPRVSASRTGIIAFRTDPEVRQQIQWVDASGKQLAAIGDPIADMAGGSLSPDGRTIAIVRVQNGEPFIWLMDMARGTLSRFSQGNAPVWAPDGARIAFQSSRDGFGRVYLQRVGSNEPAELLHKSDEAQNIVDWSPDGRFIVYASQSPTNARDLWVLPATGSDRTPMPFLQTPAEERSGAFSPDGKWFAYGSDESGPFSAFVKAFPGPGRAWRVSPGGAEVPFWRADGRAIYYMAPAGLTAVSFAAASGAPQLGNPTLVIPKGAFNSMRLLRARPDGQRYLVSALTENTPADAPLTVIVNWNGAGR
jgi:Tol biopolymer transport system component